ncbi:MAG: O-antigen ligase family protein [Candidatus Eisenbacteria bacterium]
MTRGRALACVLFAAGSLAIAGLAAWRPLVAAGAAGGTALILLSMRSPAVGLVTILAGIALLGSDSILRLRLGVEIVEADLVLLAAGAGAAARWIAGGGSLRATRLDIAFAAFAALVLFGAYRGIARGADFPLLRSELRPPLYLLVTYALARGAMGTRTDGGAASARGWRLTHRVVFAALIAVSVATAVKVLFVYASVPLGIPGGEEQRILATRVMNSSGAKRVIAHGGEIFPVLAILLLLANAPRIRRAGARVAIWFALTPLFLALAISLTRSYWLGLAAGLAALLLCRPPRKGIAALAELCGFATAAACVVLVVQRMVEGFSLRALWEPIGGRLGGLLAGRPDTSALERLAETEGVKEALRSSPWFGTGWGGTYVFYSPEAHGFREWEYIHNSYAHYLLKLGLAGALVIGALLALGSAAFAGWLRAAPDEEEKALAAGLLSGFVAILAISLTAPWLTHYVGCAWTGLVLGTAEARRCACAARTAVPATATAPAVTATAVTLAAPVVRNAPAAPVPVARSAQAPEPTPRAAGALLAEPTP